MFWPVDDFASDARHRHGQLPEHERLRHVVFLDGRLVDTWTEPVEGTAYHPMALELDTRGQLARPAPPAFSPSPAPYEAVLEWLDGVVGGRIALLALDDEPLAPAGTPPEDDEQGVHGLLERVAAELFDDEFLAAARTALAAVRRADPELLTDTPAVETAAGLAWVVGRANGLVGARTEVTQKVLQRTLWLGTSPTRKVARIKTCLHGLLARSSRRPSECPDLLELGDAAYLTAATRHRLIVLRDRALAAAEVADADRHARDALRGGAADSLTP